MRSTTRPGAEAIATDLSSALFVMVVLAADYFTATENEKRTGWCLICGVWRCPECAALHGARQGVRNASLTAPFRKHALRWSPICSAAPAHRERSLAALARPGYHTNLVAVYHWRIDGGRRLCLRKIDRGEVRRDS
jgi:hypothetical protein